MPAVTARACARPAPAAIAVYPGRYVSDQGKACDADSERTSVLFKVVTTFLSVTSLVMLFASMSGCGFLSDADEKFYFGEEKQPEELEYLYRALANELHSIKPCYLIHPHSLSRGFNAAGNQVSLLRSRCFAVVAQGSGNEQICDKVRSASTLFLSGAALDADDCRRLARAKGGTSFNLDVPGVVSLAGYDEDEVDEYLVSEGRFSSIEAAMTYRSDKSSTYWNEVRMTLLHTEDFFRRIAQFPEFGTAEDRVEMNALKWEPRQQMLWTPPEERTRSAPELRLPAQADQ